MVWSSGCAGSTNGDQVVARENSYFDDPAPGAAEGAPVWNTSRGPGDPRERPVGRGLADADAIPGRVAKQCRERWRNNLDPSVSRAPWTEEENEILLKRYDHYGSSWAEIASGLPGRPDNGCASRSLANGLGCR